MKLYCKPVLTAALTVCLSFTALGLQAATDVATSSSSETEYPTPTPKPLPTLQNCEGAVVGGVTITCPADLTAARIIQVFNPALDKGTTSASLTCVCNATFTKCDPNKTTPATASVSSPKPGELSACDVGTLRAVPSESELLGNNTTYCTTVGGVRTCFAR